MAKGKGKSSKQVGTDWREGSQGKGTDWQQATLEGSALILSVVKEAASLSPFAELKKAACVALMILRTIQAVKENREAYERLGHDSSGLIVAIWRSYKSAEVPGEWLSAEMREILEDLTHTLESICSFVTEQLSRNKMIRVVFSRADGIKINEYREHLNYAMQKFELQSHININDVLLQIVRKNDQLSEQIQHRNKEEDLKRALEAKDREMAEKIQEEEIEREKEIEELARLKQVETDRQAEDEWHSDQLKKIERQKKDRRSELERLRAAASEIERSRKSEEEEIAQLRRKIAAEERIKPMQVQSSRKKSSRVQSEVEEEEEWEGNLMVEAASSEEEEIIAQPVRTSSKVRKNLSKSPKRSSAIVDISTDDDDDDLQSVRSSKARTARRKLSSASFREEDLPSRKKSSNLSPGHRNRSSASLRVEGTDEDTDEEEDYVSRQRAHRRHQSSPGSHPIDVNGLMAHLTPLGLGGSPHWNGSGMHSNPYFPTYGASISPPVGPSYGYGMGLPGTIINSGVGNITNTTISNVGNNNSVRKVYRSPRNQR